MPILPEMLISTDCSEATDCSEVLALPLSPVLSESSFIKENNFEQVKILN